MMKCLDQEGYLKGEDRHRHRPCIVTDPAEEKLFFFIVMVIKIYLKRVGLLMNSRLKTEFGQKSIVKSLSGVVLVG